MWQVYDKDRNVKLVMTGRRHVMADWHEKKQEIAVHVAKPIRQKFWNEKIVPFFC